MFSMAEWRRLRRWDKRKLRFAIKKCLFIQRLKNNFLFVLVAYIALALFAVPNTIMGILLPVSFACAMAYITWTVVGLIKSIDFKKVLPHKLNTQ
jgi:hypothetical protein